MARRCAVGLFLAVLLGAPPAAAEVRRYALVFASNKGHGDERDLLYAESDAARVADALASLGRFSRGRIVHLVAPGPDELRAALIDLNLTIQRDLRAGGGEALLFVYYSGHGDVRSIHLGPASFPTEELSKLIKLSEAKLKIFLLDACRSGGLTRVKGGRQVTPFRIEAEDRLHNEGYAIIASSAAGEDAQESDALGSSLFTHFFLSALRGSADTNKDGLVTLGEAYAYAYEGTLKASMATVAGFQHPTFDFDLRGRFDPVLADLRGMTGQAHVTFTVPGDYLVTRSESGTIVMEANTTLPRMPVLIPEGDYRILMRDRGGMHETELRLGAGESRVVGPETMRAVSFAQVVRKGGTSRRLAQGPSVAGLVHGPLRDGFSPMLGAQVGYTVDLPWLSFMPRIGFQGGLSRTLGPDVLSNRLQETSLEMALMHVFDLGCLSVAPLFSGGMAFIGQRIVRQDPCPGDECTLSTNRAAGVLSLGAYAAYALPRGFSLDADIELANYVATVQESTETLPTWHLARMTGIPTYRATVGFGYRF